MRRTHAEGRWVRSETLGDLRERKASGGSGSRPRLNPLAVAALKGTHVTIPSHAVAGIVKMPTQLVGRESWPCLTTGGCGCIEGVCVYPDGSD